MSKKILEKCDFHDINISTRTIVISTGLEVDLVQAFEQFPVANIAVPEHFQLERTNDKLKEFIVDHKFPEGTVIAVEYKHALRGAPVVKNFRNNMSVVMIANGKLVFVKIPAQGKFQITGCNNEEQAEHAIQLMFGVLQQIPTVWKWQPNHDRLWIFRSSMINKHFNLGFHVDRVKLDYLVNTREKAYYSLFESIGYMGVNIKKPITHKEIRPMRYLYLGLHGWEHGLISYEDYLKRLSPKAYATEMKHKQETTFLVFSKGSVIMSCPNYDLMESAYNDFKRMITNARPEIEHF